MRRSLALFVVALVGCQTPEQIVRQPSPAVTVVVTTEERIAPPSPSITTKNLEAELESVARRTSDPTVRADALLRLAILISDREQLVGGPDLAKHLAQPISILRGVARENPSYPRLPQLEYELAMDLSDTGRNVESLQVLRALVCSNRYSYPVPSDPQDAERDSVVPLPQDHPPAFWVEWERAHPTPKAVAKPSADSSKEEAFQDPYPSSCTSAEGVSSTMGTDAWFRIGNANFDLLPPEAGPYALNRAASALERSIALATAKGSKATETLLAGARYKLAWTYFKQQRYEAATHAFLAVMQASPKTDYETEAVTYIAESLTVVDFVGPAATEPNIPRPDVLDTESNPHKAEAKLAIGLKRVADASLIPQEEPWAPLIYLALGREYVELSEFKNATSAFALFLSKWPLDDNALKARYEAASAWDRLSRVERNQLAARKNAALGYAGVVRVGSPGGAWYSAHENDKAALAAAADLVASAKTHLQSP